MRTGPKGFISVVLSILSASAALAAPLQIVEVAAPAINCVFDADCTITVNDSSSPILLPGSSGEGFLQSRTTPPGEAGTAGEGLIAYEYRVDLRQIGGVTALPCIHQLALDFGAHQPLDFDGDGRAEDVFVVTGGGLGSVGLASADKVGDRITFRFEPAVCAGNRPGAGESSFFFGLAAAGPPQPVTAQADGSPGVSLALEARAPGAGAGGGPGGPPFTPCLAGLPISEDVPVCRCLRDPVLRELRCGVLFPDFLLVRTSPLPIPPGDPFEVRWTLEDVTGSAGTLLIEDALPPGFERLERQASSIKFRTGQGGQQPETSGYELKSSRREGSLGMATLVTFVPDGSNQARSSELILPIGPLPWPSLDDAPAEPRPFPPSNPSFGDDPCGRAAARLWEEHLASFGASVFGPSLAAYRDLQTRAERCRRAMPPYAGLCARAARAAFAGCFLQGSRDCRLVASRAIDRCREDIFGGFGGPFGCHPRALFPCP